MENLLSVEIRSKKVYNFGSFNSGYGLFDHFLIKNLQTTDYKQLEIRVRSNPEFFSGDAEISYIAPLGLKTLSADFIKLDETKIRDLKLPSNVLYVFEIISSDGEVLSSIQQSCLINPYNYFSGFYECPESIATFVTPNQPIIQKIVDAIPAKEINALFSEIYDTLKREKLTFSQDNYFEYSSKKLRLCEEVFITKAANSLEIGVLVASMLENASHKPILVVSPRGKVYVGTRSNSKNNTLPLSMFDMSLIENSVIVDAQYFAYGSELSFDVALYNSKNAIEFSDEKLLYIDIEKIRELHILPLPNRINDNGGFTPFSETELENTEDFESYFDLLKKFSNDERVKSILTGQKLHIDSQKNHLPFDNELDVNQNKIFNKILSNDLTLIRAKNGTGVTTLYAKAAKNVLRNKKSVLYITDGVNCHTDFPEVCSKYFSNEFILDLNETPLNDKVDTSFNGVFRQSDNSFYFNNEINELYKKADKYYEKLDGGKRIVDSFYIASEKFNQFKDGNDCVVFSPEQIGVLTDPVVKEWFTVISEISNAANDVKCVYKNPLSFVKCSSFTYEYKSKLLIKLEDFVHSIEAFLSVKNEILPLFSSLGDILSYNSNNVFCDLLRLLSEPKNFSAEFFREPSKVEENFESITRLIQLKRENKVKLDTIFMVFDESILNLDAEETLNQWKSANADKSFKAFSLRHSIIKNVKKYLVPNCDFENIELVLTNLAEYHKNDDIINKSVENVYKLCEVSPDDKDAWEKIKDISEYCYQIYSVYRTNFDAEKLFDFATCISNALKIDSFPEKVSKFISSFEEFEKIKSEIDSLTYSEVDSFYSNALALDADYFEYILSSMNELLISLDGLKSWCNWLSVRKRANDIGLKNVIKCLENGRLENGEIKKAFIRAFFKAICEHNFIISPEISPDNDLFDKIYYEISENESKAASALLSETNAILSIEKIDATNVIRGTDITVSDLINERIEIVNKIYPVICADVFSAKKLFEDKNIKFDYVFVESKGKILLGDILWLFKNCEHISFSGKISEMFNSNGKFVDTSLSAFDYLWRISDDKYSMSCVYKNSPAIVAKNSLYINAADSDSRLYSVPASGLDKSFTFERVRGFYNVDFKNANYQEAEFAVNKIKEFIDSEYSSISIISSTKEQSELVLKLLAKEISENEEYKDKIISSGKKISVFSLNDEFVTSDLVYYLFTFAPDKSVHGAKLPYEIISAFGLSPDNCISNVISSARKKFVLVASFSPEELKFSSSVMPTVSSLKLLFDLSIDNDSNVSYDLAEMPTPNSFIPRLCADLKENGFETLIGVKSGRFYIDAAVIDKNGEFVLGIISDTTVLNQSNNVFSVEYLNFINFKKAGWNIYRLRSPKCFDSYERELDKILSILGVDVYGEDIV